MEAKNLWLLPTDKPSRLYLGNLGKPVTIQSASAQLKKPLSLHITNDEEIGESAYLDVYENKVVPCNHENGPVLTNKLRYFKIIMTTDKELIKDGVQAIDDEFLEWFVKNPSCEYVETIYDKNIFTYGVQTTKYGAYKIIIPKEEPKQETLEELEAAYAAHKTIQSKSSGEWRDFIPQNQIDSPNWEYGGLDNWRIKPDNITDDVKQETFEEFIQRVFDECNIIHFSQQECKNFINYGIRWQKLKQDEFAIEFAEWVRKETYYEHLTKEFIYKRNVYSCEKELLEIFKKEKGL